MSSGEIPPGLRRVIGSVFIIVDSTPTSHDPPSKMAFIFPSRSSKTSIAEVGLILPDKFAEGAAIGTPALD
jgi:hypothetical protein